MFIESGLTTMSLLIDICAINKTDKPWLVIKVLGSAPPLVVLCFFSFSSLTCLGAGC